MRREKMIEIRKIITVSLATVLVMFIFSGYQNNRSIVYADSANTEIVLGSENDSETEERIDAIDQEVLGDEEINTDEQITNNEDVKSEDSKIAAEKESTNDLEESIDKKSVDDEEIPKEQDLRALAPGEVVVKTFLELKKAIEEAETKGYHTIYLGADINNAENIIVNKVQDLTIDGKNPTSGQIHSLNEKENYDDSLFIMSGNTKSLTIKNINISGHANKALVSTNSDYAANVYFKDITYNGPFLASLPFGTIFIENSSLTIKGNALSTESFGALALNIELSGNNTIHSDSYMGATFEANERLVFKSGSKTVFESIDAIIYSNDYGSMIVEKDAYIQYKQLKTYFGTKSDTIITTEDLQLNGTLEIDVESSFAIISVVDSIMINQGTLNIKANKVDAVVLDGGDSGIEIDNSRVSIDVEEGQSSIVTGFSLFINNNSILNIKVGTHANALIDVGLAITVHESQLNINTGLSEVRKNAEAVIRSNAADINFENSHVSIDTGNINYGTILQASTEVYIISLLGSSSSFAVINRSTQTPSFVSANNVLLSHQQINLFKNIPDSNIIPPNNNLGAEKIYRKNNFASMVDVSFRSNGDSTSGHTSSSLSDLNDIEEINPNGYPVVSMGNMLLEVPKQTEDLYRVQMKTNPNTLVELGLTPPMNFKSDEKGIVDERVEQMIPNGDHSIKVYGNYLYNERNIEYEVDGNLEFLKVPESLDFGTLKLKTEPTVYKRKTGSSLKVVDARLNRTGYKIGVYLETDLHIPTVQNSSLRNSLVYQDDDGKNHLIPTDPHNPLIIKEMSETNYNPEFEMNWTEEKGVLLQIKSYADVLINEGYEAKLVWVLIAN